jgi:hypothetical protein
VTAIRVINNLIDLTGDLALSAVAQGDMLYRGASKWNNLAAGTSGQFLQTQGSGANPRWHTLSSADVTGALGYTPVNRAGDTITGPLHVTGGSVGIGTTSPVGQLDVVGAAGTDTLHLHVHDTGPYLFSYYNDAFSASPAVTAYMDNSGNFYVGTTGNTSYRIYTNNTANPRVTILGNGNVGVGATSPAYLLDVAGAARFGGNVGFFGGTPVGQQTGGAATAGGTYGSTEQTMLNALYSAMRAYGLLT